MKTRDQVRHALENHPYPVKWESRWDDPSAGGNGTFIPEKVLLHHTAGTNSLGILMNTAWPPVRAANFLIDRDGTVHVLTAFTAYHAGNGGPKWGIAQDRGNQALWGIEIEDLGQGKTMSDKEIDSAAHLTAGLLSGMGTDDVGDVVQHKAWSNTGKVDTRYTDSFWRDKVSAVMEGDNMPLTDKDIDAIAKAVNRTLGDWKADGDVQDSASDPPQTGSTRLRDLQKRVAALEADAHEEGTTWVGK